MKIDIYHHEQLFGSVLNGKKQTPCDGTTQEYPALASTKQLCEPTTTLEYQIP